jgi:hypothetical protein
MIVLCVKEIVIGYNHVKSLTLPGLYNCVKLKLKHRCKKTCGRCREKTSLNVNYVKLAANRSKNVASHKKYFVFSSFM